jgi:hypothetical protein
MQGCLGSVKEFRSLSKKKAMDGWLGDFVDAEKEQLGSIYRGS